MAGPHGLQHTFPPLHLTPKAFSAKRLRLEACSNLRDLLLVASPWDKTPWRPRDPVDRVVPPKRRHGSAANLRALKVPDGSRVSGCWIRPGRHQGSLRRRRAPGSRIRHQLFGSPRSSPVVGFGDIRVAGGPTVGGRPTRTGRSSPRATEGRLWARAVL